MHLKLFLGPACLVGCALGHPVEKRQAVTDLDILQVNFLVPQLPKSFWQQRMLVILASVLTSLLVCLDS